MKDGATDFQAKNETQFFLARTLSLCFIQMTMLDRFIEYIKHSLETESEKPVMDTVASIYGLWCLEKHLGHLYQFGILKSGQQVTLIHENLLQLCKRLLPNAVALADVLAPPDFILNSILGNSDGQVYQHLKQSFFTNTFGRANYWSDMISSKL